jgi:hypothetical protein
MAGSGWLRDRVGSVQSREEHRQILPPSGGVSGTLASRQRLFFGRDATASCGAVVGHAGGHQERVVIQALRPLTIGELLDRTFTLYRSHFLMFVGIAALSNLAVLAVELLMIATSWTDATLLELLASCLTVVVALVATMMMQGATMIAVSRLQLGEEPSATDAFDQIRERLGELVILALNLSIRIGLGLLLLVVPGVILALRYALAMPVAVLENKGIGESIERSRDLTRGSLRRIFVIYFLLVVLMVIVSAIARVALLALGVGSAAVALPFWAQAMNLSASYVVNVLTAPVFTISIALVYYDQRVRKEGFDLEHMLAQLDGSTLSAPPLT